MDSYGILALIPPLIAVIVAIATKQVIISFFLAVWVGATILAGFNPVVGLVDVFGKYVYTVMTSPSNAAVLFNTLMIGGFAIMIERGGGAYAFSRAFQRSKLSSRKTGQLAAWLGGIVCFFSDSTNAIVLGPIFRPITDAVKVSREKLAYIVDSTASPVALLIPFSTWGAYLMGLVATQNQELGIDQTGLVGLAGSIPFNYYAIGAVVMVLIVALSGRDYGPMKRAERLAQEGKFSTPSGEIAEAAEVMTVPEGAHPTVANVLVPLAVLVASIMGMFLWTGGFPENSVLDALGAADPMVSLGVSFFLTGVVAVAMTVQSKVLSFKEALSVYFSGARRMVDVIFILVFAWSVGALCKDLGTADFIVGVTQGFLTPTLMYLLTFAGACITSFATGSSWGTFAIFIPIAMPMAAATGAPIAPAIGAALSGGLFGDHCSPISDTTILSAMGSSCNNIDHVNTQLPYALTVAGSAAVGYLLTGLFNSALAGLVGMVAALVAVVFLLHKFMGEKIGAGV